MKKAKLSLRHEFTPKEFDSMRDELARVTIEAGDAKDRAKAQAAANKEDLDILDGRRKHLSRQILAKGEDRETDVLVRYNIPREGFKQTIRLDTGEIAIESQTMTFDERQSHLFKDPDLEELEKIYGGDGPDRPAEGEIENSLFTSVQEAAARQLSEERVAESNKIDDQVDGSNKIDSPSGTTSTAAADQTPSNLQSIDRGAADRGSVA